MTFEERKKANEEKGWFPVACRLCGEITWFHKDFYKEADFTRGYECHKHRILGVSI